ncbi:3-ketoacyl-CoA thiolase @ Acetyl-CoA acetyltransferase [hydrothermal vent metagenome]|uniref:3-ketoacyl-CoA thiolase @ Acetyl-CoA acetyltransferase n=1 Tax=hydrothermal vent metagenome TaxID=652676 RepID=A0A3B0ZXV5_9ZZZZ
MAAIKKKTVKKPVVAATKKTTKKASAKKPKQLRDVYVVDGSRTPFLKARGRPGPFKAIDLALGCARPLMARQKFNADNIDEVIMGCVMPGPDEANIARILALRLGCGKHVPAWTVQRNCASGLQALDCAMKDIGIGKAEIILAGGIEAMSHAPILFNDTMVNWLSDLYSSKTVMKKLKTISQLRLKHLKPIIALIRGLTDPVVGLSMGQTAENLAYKFNIDRASMDNYATQSHQRLAAAQDNKYLDEIDTIYSTNGKFYNQDDGVRKDSNVAGLAKLKPVFDRHFGKVTAGNSAQITDGASMLFLASEKAIKKYNLPIMGKLVDSEWAGLEPAQMGLGPVHAMTPLLKRNNLEILDIDYWEINEAFAAQVIANVEAWKDIEYCKTHLGLKAPLGEIPSDKLNIDGGGVSLGHPVGASGARIVLHLFSVLKRTNSKQGIASLCIGGGQGGAILIERVEEL